MPKKENYHFYCLLFLYVTDVFQWERGYIYFCMSGKLYQIKKKPWIIGKQKGNQKKKEKK